MKGQPEIIQALNEVLTGELTAINQYFLHARICKDWGYEKLAKYIYEESIEEMKHAQSLVDRVLFLDGLPNLQKLDTLSIGETVEEILKHDLAMEMVAIPRCKRVIKLAHESGDHVTKEMIEHILIDEEKHVDWLESQLKLISDMGIQNYLAQQVHAG